jgi:hypothetical protein
MRSVAMPGQAGAGGAPVVVQHLHAGTCLREGVQEAQPDAVEGQRGSVWGEPGFAREGEHAAFLAQDTQLRLHPGRGNPGLGIGLEQALEIDVPAW